MKTQQHKQFKSGAVSLYVVIFTTLLISVITLSFLRIMLNEQTQTINSDLSQSAFDSALAGTQDAKTLIMMHHDCLSRGDNSGTCHNIARAIAAQGCDTISDSGVVPGAAGGGEVPIVEGGADNPMNQAYTCVVIEMNTTDFVSESIAGESTIVPLRFTGDVPPEEGEDGEDVEVVDPLDQVQYITIQWFTQVNNQNSSNLALPELPQSALTFPSVQQWGQRPSVLRVQLIQTAEEFTLDQFDRNEGTSTNRATMFFFPTNVADVRPAPEPLTAEQVAQTSSRTVQAPFAASCMPGFQFGGRYACQATFRLPNPIQGPDGSTRRHPGTAFLRITPLYRTTEFRVIGMNSDMEISEGTRFLGTQPSVDVTARANNVFRRVVSRIELSDVGFPFPEFAVELNDENHPFCKAMLLTDVYNESVDEGGCLPGSQSR